MYYIRHGKALALKSCGSGQMPVLPFTACVIFGKLPHHPEPQVPLKKLGPSTCSRLVGTEWGTECEAFSTMPGIESKGSKYSRWFDCHALFFWAFVGAVVLATLKLCNREMVQNSAKLFGLWLQRCWKSVLFPHFFYWWWMLSCRLEFLPATPSHVHSSLNLQGSRYMITSGLDWIQEGQSHLSPDNVP